MICQATIFQLGINFLKKKKNSTIGTWTLREKTVDPGTTSRPIRNRVVLDQQNGYFFTNTGYTE